MIFQLEAKLWLLKEKNHLQVRHLNANPSIIRTSENVTLGIPEFPIVLYEVNPGTWSSRWKSTLNSAL